ncbi:MAG: hypothetical protein K0M40_07665 [Prolixibacteraceae bacterium]|nr:hypothetical protein [Prolixibacteraceae bacterium]
MKTKLSLKQSGWIIALFFGIFISSCSKEVTTDISESDLTLKSATIPQAGDMVCDLIAGQTIDVGKVVYSHDGNQFLVEFVTTGGWILSEVHFYVGTLDEFQKTCMNKNAIQIGKFPYSAVDLNSTTHSLDPITLAIPAPEGGYMVVAHAVVKKVNEDGTIQEETAFAKCTYPLLITVKVTFESNKWAATEGIYYFNDKGWIGPWLGVNIFENGKNMEYMLQNWEFPVSTGGAGKVNISDNGININVLVTPKEGLTLQTTHLFVGTMEELVELGQYTGGCPDYKLFPYKNSEVTPTHSFVIPIPAMPLPNFVSFQSAPLNSSRWGWYSYYNF